MRKGKFAVAAILMLVAGSALASNFRVADQVYLPAAGHLTGSRGETFVTDVWISNLNNEAVDVSAIFSSGAAGGNFQNFDKYLTLAANEHKEIIDFISAAKTAGGLALANGSFGQVIFNGCKAGGNCDITTCPNGQATGICADFRNISVEARIYAIPAGGTATAPTYGQQFPGIPWYNFVSSDAQGAGLDKVFITGLRETGTAFGQNGTYRTNIGLVNASQYSSTVLLVKLFDKTGTQIGTYNSPTLGPLGQQQLAINAMFGSFTGSSATGAYITVEQISVQPTADAGAAGCGNGCPSFLAYGSLLDNGSDDSTTLETQYVVPLSDAAQQCIYNLNCKGSVKLHRSVHH